jgi:molybdopterin synthase catalytic subunit
MSTQGIVRGGVSREPISLDLVARELRRPGHGAQVLFEAVVRPADAAGNPVAAIRYDAGPDADEVLRAIASEAQARFGWAVSVVLLHRVGRVPAGEVCMVIGTSAPHNREAYEASRHVLEQFRARSPFKKKEEEVERGRAG